MKYELMSNRDFFSLFSDKDMNFYPFGSPAFIHQKYGGNNIVLYGGGVYGKRFFFDNKKTCSFNIVAWIDKDFKSKSATVGEEIFSPEKLYDENLEYDFIFVAIKKEGILQEVYNYLTKEIKINKEKIMTLYNLDRENPILDKISSQYDAIPTTEWKQFHNTIELSKPYVCTSMICNQEFLDSPVAQYWSQKMRDGDPVYHRKRWELIYICQSLWERGCLKEGKKGLAFGVGVEHLPDLFASLGCNILATDLNFNESAAKGWVESNQNAGGNLEKLRKKQICDDKTFYSHVSYRDVNMNDIPNDITGYDFCWSTCALEHLGSIRHGLEFIKNSLKTLKPGGIAVHTTEYNLYSNDATLEVENLSLFRRKDIEKLIRELQDQGHYVYPMDWHLGTNIVDHFIDLPPSDRKKMHLRLLIDKFPCTSIGIIIQKHG